MKILLDLDGDLLFEKDGKYYLRYDAGGVAVRIKDLEISKQEAINILNSNDRERLMYEIIISYHNRRISGEDVLPFNN